MLDLLNDVAGHLQSLDISNQRLLMARKYALLSARLKSSDKVKAHEMARKALEEGNITKCMIKENSQLNDNMVGYPMCIRLPLKQLVPDRCDYLPIVQYRCASTILLNRNV